MRNQVEASFRDYLHISQPEDFTYYHSLYTLAHNAGNLENEKRYHADCEPNVNRFKGTAANFTATGRQIYDQMIERNLEMKEKLKKIETFEEEMNALINDFDFDLEQI